MSFDFGEWVQETKTAKGRARMSLRPLVVAVEKNVVEPTEDLKDVIEAVQKLLGELSL